MARVKLSDLNPRRNATGKWYVSIRSTGQSLVKGYEGTRADLDRHLASNEVLARYAALTGPKKVQFDTGSLGELIQWFQSDPHSRWGDLHPKPYAARTRKDYSKVIEWLERPWKSGFRPADYLVCDMSTADIVELQEQSAQDRYLKFSNDVVAFLSALFARAKLKGKIRENPAVDIPRLYTPSGSANRNWQGFEWEWVKNNAPAHLRLPLMIMRHAGPRGKDTHLLTRSNYIETPEGKVLTFEATKNGRVVVVFVVEELATALDAACADLLPAARICRNRYGKEYPSENALRKVWQDFKASKAFKEALPESGDLTLHGLRVTYAGEVKELGLSDMDVAWSIGDSSASMGRHYSRRADPIKLAKLLHEARTKGA